MGIFYQVTGYADDNESIYTYQPWAVMGYWGKMTDNTLGQVIKFDYKTTQETLYSLEFSHQLMANNPLRKFFSPIVSTIEVIGNVTYRDDPVGPIYEFNPYLAFRWQHLPWNNIIVTSFAMGEGLSYDSQVPQVEARNSEETQSLLNYLMLEATFALPNHPQWELVARIHHRSGVFGLYDAGNNGSTAVGVGIRYRF
jgi:hypothetical protein